LKNLNLLIDTGAVPSVLDRQIAEKSHLIGNTEKLSVFTQQETSMFKALETGAAGLSPCAHNVY